MRPLRLTLLPALAMLALASSVAPEPAEAAATTGAVALTDGATVQSVYYYRHPYRRPYYRRHHYRRPYYRHYGSDAVQAHRA